MPNIAQNLQRVKERILAAARLAGRYPEDITLVAVSKTHPWPQIAQALDADQLDFGENRPEEAYAKIIQNPEATGATLRLHLIGPIQSRKAKVALACQPHLIHSIDRIKIARKLNTLAAAQNQILDALLEVNISGESSKHGWGPQDLQHHLPELLTLSHLRFHGLMTIPPYDPNPETARPVFRALRQLRDTLAHNFPGHDWSQLSMGMSHDFEIAIAEGATIVRVGTAIFGARGQ
jgi:pyridoxal phosphate enzyme (YggS family)